MSDQPSLFDRQASIRAGRAARDRAAAKHEAEIQALIPLALELAAKAPDGITVANLRLAAVSAGVLTGEERGRALSYLGVVLSRAGLKPTGDWRRSGIVKSHGNAHRVFVLPSQREGAA